MAKQSLSPHEIRQLGEQLREVYLDLERRQRETPIAEHIKFPPIPPILTKSLALACANKWFGGQWRVELGNRQRETIALSSNGKSMSIAVKSTGRSGFQEVKDKDLKGDYFVWINFGDWFSKGTGGIEVYILPSPRQIIRAAAKLTLDRFKELGQGVLTSTRYASLKEMLA